MNECEGRKMSKEILLTLMIVNNILLLIIAIFYKKIKKNLFEKIENKKIRTIIYFIIVIGIIILNKYLSYEIDKYKINSQLMLDLFNGNLKFMFNKRENPIINLVEIIVNISQSLDIYLGVISVLVAIYIYSISLGDDFKKYVLLTLLGEGKTLYLVVSLLVLYFFNISPILFITLNIAIFYEMYNMIKTTFKIMNTMYFKDNWKDKIIPELKKEKNRKNLENIYFELRKRITKAMLEKDFIVFEEMIAYYKTLLMTDGFEVPKDFIEDREKEEAVGFLYDTYIYLLENRDDNLFDKIENLNIDLAEYYLEKEDYRLAREYYSFLNLKYDYLSEKYKDNKEEKGFHIFTGLRYYHSSIKNLNEDKEIIILKSILDLFYKLIKERKYDELEEYRLIFTKKDSFLELYARVIVFHFLIRLDRNRNNNGIERIIDFFKTDILNIVWYNPERIKYLYNLSKEKQWEKEFGNIGLNYFKVDVLGRASRECSYDFDNTVLILADTRNRRLD